MTRTGALNDRNHMIHVIFNVLIIARTSNVVSLIDFIFASSFTTSQINQDTLAILKIFRQKQSLKSPEYPGFILVKWGASTRWSSSLYCLTLTKMNRGQKWVIKTAHISMIQFGRNKK